MRPEPSAEVLGLRGSPGGVDQRGGGGLADVGQGLSDGLRVGEEGDEGEGFQAGRTDQREGFIDSSQEGGPFGRPGRGGGWSLGWWAGWVRGWGRGDQVAWTLPEVPGIYQAEVVLDFGPDGVAFDAFAVEVA